MNEKEWRQRYKQRLLECGVDEEFAQETADAAEVILDESPEDLADDEMSYWAD